MDTLCVSVHDDNLRKIAITQMREIYTHAHRVLLLDSSVLSKSVDSPISDKAAAIYLSNWQTRLWTLQEGLLPSNLFFQFKDAPAAWSGMAWNGRRSQKLIHMGSYLATVPIDDLHIAPQVKRAFRYRGQKNSSRILMFAEHLRSRVRTCKSDETICLATLVEMDPIIYSASKHGRYKPASSRPGKKSRPRTNGYLTSG